MQKAFFFISLRYLYLNYVRFDYITPKNKSFAKHGILIKM